MSDANVPIAPGSNAPGPPLVNIRTFLVLDANGQPVQIQGVALLDANGQPYSPLSEATGQIIVQALRELHIAFVAAQGGIPPTY